MNKFRSSIRWSKIVDPRNRQRLILLWIKVISQIATKVWVCCFDIKPKKRKTSRAQTMICFLSSLWCFIFANHSWDLVPLQIQKNPIIYIPNSDLWILSCLWSADGKEIYTIGSENYLVILVWQILSGSFLQ